MYETAIRGLFKPTSKSVISISSGYRTVNDGYFYAYRYADNSDSQVYIDGFIVYNYASHGGYSNLGRSCWVFVAKGQQISYSNFQVAQFYQLIN